MHGRENGPVGDQRGEIMWRNARRYRRGIEVTSVIHLERNVSPIPGLSVFLFVQHTVDGQRRWTHEEAPLEQEGGVRACRNLPRIPGP